MASEKDTRDTVVEGAPRRRDSPLPRGVARTLGRYVLLDKLGEGGMGTVMLAYDPKLDRKVAIKLLLAAGSPADQLRLQREAQAAARLNHPNVIAVHDVGTEDDQVYVALEYVDGTTLRHWLAAAQRSPEEIVAKYCEAARGLAAAHRAGIVHRDFKPDNVLIGADERPRVTDFGLARLAVPEREPGNTQPLDVTLTHSAILGTPGYMAPELYREDSTADARSDQFALCAALYEALYDVRPFSGSTIDEVEKSTSSGVLAAPKRTDSPTWLRPIVARGLAVDPADRHPSVDALIAALTPDRGQRRRIVVGLAAIVAVAGAVVLWPRTTPAASPCDADTFATWTDDDRLAIQHRFLEVAPVQSTRAWPLVAAAFDDYKEKWLAQHRAACSATREQGQQSESGMELRMICLDRRLHDAQALIRALREAEPASVTRSPIAASGLPSPADCEDVTALSTPSPLPSEPTARAQIEAAYAQLSRANALRGTGKYKEAADIARVEVEHAKLLGYQPLLARAWEQLARSQEKLQDLPGAFDSASRALWAGELGSDDSARLAALGRLAWFAGQLKRFTEAEGYYKQARALATRHDEPFAWAEILNSYANTLNDQLESEQCITLEREALAILARVRPRDPNRHVFEATLSSCLSRTGNYAEAARVLDGAREGIRATFGPDHPFAIELMIDHALLLGQLGQHARARDVLREMLDRMRAQGETPRWHALHDNYAMELIALGRYSDALAVIDRELPIVAEALGAESPEAEYLIGHRIGALHGLREFAKAEPDRKRLLAISEKRYGVDKVNHLQAQLYVAEALLGTHSGDRGAAIATHVLDRAPNLDFTINAGVLLATALEDAGKHTEAVEIARRMMKVCDANQVSGLYCGDLRSLLAHDAVARGEPATTIVEAARKDYGRTDEVPAAEHRDVLDRWWAGNRSH